MKKNLIEAIVAAVFGLVILVVGICTNAGAAVIVLGALLLAIGIVFILLAFKDNTNEIDDASMLEAENEELEARIIELEQENETLKAAAKPTKKTKSTVKE